MNEIIPKIITGRYDNDSQWWKIHGFNERGFLEKFNCHTYTYPPGESEVERLRKKWNIDPLVEKN